MPPASADTEAWAAAAGREWGPLCSRETNINSAKVSFCKTLLLSDQSYLINSQFSSVTQSCPTLCNPMECSMLGFPVHHQLPEFAQTHVHRLADAIQPSYPLPSPSPLAFNLFQHQGLFEWVSSSHQVAKVLELQFQHQSFQWIFRVDFLWDWLVWLPCFPRDSQQSSPTPQFKGINSSKFSLHGPTLTSTHDYWKNHSFDYMDLCQQSNVSVFNMLSRLVTAFLPRSKCLLITWLQSPFTAMLELKKIKSLTACIVSLRIYYDVMGPIP